MNWAHGVGYHRTSISQLERGEKSPSPRKLFNLAGTLDVSLSRIITQIEQLLRK